MVHGVMHHKKESTLAVVSSKGGLFPERGFFLLGVSWQHLVLILCLPLNSQHLYGM